MASQAASQGQDVRSVMAVDWHATSRIPGCCPAMLLFTTRAAARAALAMSEAREKPMLPTGHKASDRPFPLDVLRAASGGGGRGNHGQPGAPSQQKQQPAAWSQCTLCGIKGMSCEADYTHHCMGARHREAEDRMRGSGGSGGPRLPPPPPQQQWQQQQWQPMLQLQPLQPAANVAREPRRQFQGHG